MQEELIVQQDEKTSEAEEKPNIIVVVLNLPDGTGDFGHGRDVFEFFNTLEQLRNYNIVYINVYDTEKAKRIDASLNELNVSQENVHRIQYDSRDNATRNTNARAYIQNHPRLKKQLENAPVIFAVSNDLFTNLIESYMKPHLCVGIGEHGGVSFDAYNANNINYRHMGLTENYNGLLVKELPKKTKEEVLKNINNKHFLKNLLGVQSEDYNENAYSQFAKDTLFIPGYLHTSYGLPSFIKTLATHQSISNKNITFYINQKDRDGKDYVTKNEKLFDDLFQNGVDEIEININGKQSFHTKQGKQPGDLSNKSVRILGGFDLNDNDYDNIFYLADKFAGCGGDKTLEKGISHGLLPWYSLVTKPDVYDQFIEFIKNQTKQEDNALIRYFAALRKIPTWSKHAEGMEEMQKIDLTEAYAIWQKVQPIIIKDHNMYNRLSTIVSESLLFGAVVTNDLEKVKEFSTQIPDLWVKDNMDRTALQNAYFKNNLTIFKFFTETHLKQQLSMSDKLNELLKIFNHIKKEEFKPDTPFKRVTVSEEEKQKRLRIYTDYLQKEYLSILQNAEQDPMAKGLLSFIEKNPDHLKFIEFDVSGEFFKNKNNTSDLKQAIEHLTLHPFGAKLLS